MVAARSGAEIPVLVLPRASMGTHIAVSRIDEFTETDSGISSASSRSGVIARHTRPRPCVTMKFTISGVTFSAATVRSPSFSRSSSSTTITMRPSRMASTACSTGEKGLLDLDGRARRRRPALDDDGRCLVMIRVPPGAAN